MLADPECCDGSPELGLSGTLRDRTFFVTFRISSQQ